MLRQCLAYCCSLCLLIKAENDNKVLHKALLSFLSHTHTPPTPLLFLDTFRRRMRQPDTPFLPRELLSASVLADPI